MSNLMPRQKAASVCKLPPAVICSMWMSVLIRVAQWDCIDCSVPSQSLQYVPLEKCGDCKKKDSVS